MFGVNFWKYLGEKKRKPFLDQLCDLGQDGVLLTDTEIKEQVDTIMFEVCSFFYTLSK